MAAEEQLDNSLETAVSQALASEPKPAEARLTPFQSKRPSLTEQYEVYERCGVELRRRLTEERSALMAAHQRQVAAYEEEVRQHVVEMKADREQKLREHELLSRRLGL